MKRLIIIQMMLALTLSLFAASPTRQLQGEVRDEAGEELIGATVKVDGTTLATATDVDGRFVLNVPAGSEIKLTVSYVGYSTRSIKVAPDENNLNIKLEVSANEMEEMVVIGYGTAKKSSLTSSVEVLKASDLQKIPSLNIDQSLAGQVSGLGVTMTSADPSTAKESRISVRGNTGNPLLVIDGVPRLGTNTNDGEMRLSDLNPDDIESISILKDAAAAAVYGSRAANGVILVQTKRGQTSGKARVNYRGQFNFEQATNLPKFLSAYDFARLYNRAVENSSNSVYTPIDLDALDSDPNLYADENLMDHLKKWGHSQSHSVSVSGGGNTVRYFFSGAYSQSKGLYSNIGRSRYNYTGKIDADLFPGLTASVDFNGSVSSYKNTSYATLDEAYAYSPLQVLRYTDGNLASIEGYNPLINLEGKGGYTKNNTDFHTVSAILRYDIPLLKGLQVYLRGTMDFNHNNNTEYGKPVELYIYDPITGTTTVDENTVYPKAKITMSERFQSVRNKLVEAGINYNHTFAEKHDVSGTVVVNYQDYHNKYLRANNNDKPGALPEVIGSASNNVTISGNEYYNQRASVVGRASYGFDNRYFAEFSFRVDGSTRFAPGKRWGFFPT
ncbi:MAG: SusC/RagA family TonB-linked outer membrane protein, partial [Muribaculaceae bacterium]|nr:SusC/RagA family TonB-linked outer membrane protein [Muribaculaceae bacterium]